MSGISDPLAVLGLIGILAVSSFAEPIQMANALIDLLMA